MIQVKELDLMLLALSQYISVNDINNPNLKDNLKGYIEELYDSDLIENYPINKQYKVSVDGNDVIVNLKMSGEIIKYVINKENSYYTNISKYGE